MRRLVTIIFLSIIGFSAFNQNSNIGLSTIDQKVDSLLNLMTLNEKIGQMAQAERGALENISDISYYGLGSLLSGGGSAPVPNNRQEWANMYDNYQSYAMQSRLGIPLLYGSDAVHGHNNVYGAVIFPHNIGMGCTWNYDLVKSANEIVAKEVAATGVDWTFSPCIAVPRDERWGRTYEGFGETAEIQKIMAAASVEGLQGNNLSSNETILACAKHFVGDGGTTGGDDQGNTIASEEQLREIHMAGYIEAINKNVGSIMASYSSWNGIKMHGNQYLLTDVLKTELGFDGFVVSDWKGVDQLDGDYREAVKRAINAGIDMVMVPDRYIYFISVLKGLVNDNEVSIDRIDDAVRRILKQKFLMNLFEEPYTDNSLASSFGSAEHRDIARQCVRESLVLLKAKNNILPLNKNNQRIIVAGNMANDLGAQCGGWTISWQGSNGNITEGTNILEGIQKLSETSEIVYSADGNFSGDADAIIAVIGEKTPYAEGAGDRGELNIDTDQISMIKNLKQKGIPVIVLLVSGRPMIIGDVIPYSDAVIACWLPGTEGDGIAQILFGDYNPSGKLTHSWSANNQQIPINFGDDNYQPLFAYKYGMTDFPSSANSQFLKFYSGIAETANEISLSLSDEITQNNSAPAEFIVKINGLVVDNDVVSIYVNETDATKLVLELNSEINTNDLVELSYSGDGIYSNNLPLENFTDQLIYNVSSTSGGVNDIPGTVQAENYFDMQGVQTEPCTDIGGGLNVGWIEPGDWMKYNVEVAQDGLYEVTARISGYVGGSLLLQFDGTNNTFVNYQPTDGWQSWQNFKSTLNLQKGTYVMKFTASTDGFNINYFKFDLLNGIDENKQLINNIVVSPNPVKSSFKLSMNLINTEEVSINLFDMGGKKIQHLYDGILDAGKQDLSLDLYGDIRPANYFIEIKTKRKRYFRKIIVN